MKINGMVAALKQMNNLPQKANGNIQKAINSSANRIVSNAASNAPGSIGGHIVAEPGELSSLISVGTQGMDDYAAWVEFGTGPYAKEYVATLPPEWQDEAMKFFISGKGKGHPYPYLFPAIMKNTPKLLEAIEKELQKLAK